jgi:hypothetical protein
VVVHVQTSCEFERNELFMAVYKTCPRFHDAHKESSRSNEVKGVKLTRKSGEGS